MAQDIFSDVEPAPASTSASGGWQKPNVPKPAVFQPKPAIPANVPAAAYNFDGATPGFNFKRFMVIGGLILAIGALAGGGWWGYKKYSATSPGGTANVPAAEEKIDGNQGAEPAKPAEIPVNPETNTVIPPTTVSNNTATSTTAPKDSDDDGLTDEEEAALGTNPNSVDSDNDGLFDREEVKVYGTDPLKPDTDGDGYTDGQEVKGGFNPLGWGKLFDAANPTTNKTR